MTAEMANVVSTLKSLHVGPEVLKLVREKVRESEAPKLSDSVVERLREVAGSHKRAMLVLGRNGYSVFSPEGHDKLVRTARKYKPWAARSRKRSKPS